MKIYKKEIAIEQLEASIELFFQDEYPIPTHNIIMSQNVLLHDLCIKKWLETTLDYIRKDKHSEFLRIQRELSNFSKHSERDTIDYIELKLSSIEEVNNIMLTVNIFLFTQLYPDYMSEKIKIYYAYMINNNPSLFNLDKNKLDEINKVKNEMNIELSKEKIYSLFFK